MTQPLYRSQQDFFAAYHKVREGLKNGDAAVIPDAEAFVDNYMLLRQRPSQTPFKGALTAMENDIPDFYILMHGLSLLRDHDPKETPDDPVQLPLALHRCRWGVNGFAEINTIDDIVEMRRRQKVIQSIYPTNTDLIEGLLNNARRAREAVKEQLGGAWQEKAPPTLPSMRKMLEGAYAAVTDEVGSARERLAGRPMPPLVTRYTQTLPEAPMPLWR